MEDRLIKLDFKWMGHMIASDIGDFLFQQNS